MFEKYSNVSIQEADATDEYDVLRKKWKAMLTGGTCINTTDTDIAEKICSITNDAQSYWNSMDKSTERTCLWSDIASTDISANVTKSYHRIKAMAIAYNNMGSLLYGNVILGNDITEAMEWMYSDRYNGNFYDNWWDWMVGAPLILNDCTVLMYDLLSTSQILNYMSKIAGYNAKKYSVMTLCGIILKNSTTIQNASDVMSTHCTDVTSGNFFYSDGTYIQHEDHPYNLGYGAGELLNTADLMYLLSGSTWDVSDSDKQNVFNRVYKCYEPLIYKGIAMDMVRGREMSRFYNEDHIASVQVISAIARLAQFAPSADAAAFKSMIKYWINSNKAANFYTIAELLDIVVNIKDIMADSSVVPREDLILNKQYPSMDRAVHIRPDFAFGISMHSSRIANYEGDINKENLKAWHTGDGMTYLYNSDQRQFNDNFWPTVNNYRLPGTTVRQSTTSASDKKSSRSWVGGSSLQDTYGTTGMDYHAYGYDLQAKKSWFMFDKEIVALGAGISSTDNKVVETVVENRKLNSSGNNALIVNGKEKPTNLGWSETMTGLNWAHLTGNESDAKIGYYFPGGANINGIRESRTDNWNSININPSNDNPTNYTNQFLTMWFDHGTNPTLGAYEYVLLPNMSASQVSSYASNPQITILRNDTYVQAVQQTELDIIGANFWTDTNQTVDIISSDKKASIMTKITSSDIEISVSDPTQLNTEIITVTINKAATILIYKDSSITVLQYSPTIILSVNASELRGKTVKAIFSC